MRVHLKSALGRSRAEWWSGTREPSKKPTEINSRAVGLDPQESPGQIKRREVERDESPSQENPRKIKSREVELDPQDIKKAHRDQQQGGGTGPSREPRPDQEEGGGAGLSREPREDQALKGGAGPSHHQESPGKIKSEEVELGPLESCPDSPLLQLFLNSCFSDTVFVTLLHAAVKTTISKVHKLLRTGRVPTSLMLSGGG